MSEKKHGPPRKTELSLSLIANWEINGLLFRAYWMAVRRMRSKIIGILPWSAKSNLALKLALGALDPARDNVPQLVTNPAKREDSTFLAMSRVSSFFFFFLMRMAKTIIIQFREACKVCRLSFCVSSLIKRIFFKFYTPRNFATLKFHTHHPIY